VYKKFHSICSFKDKQFSHDAVKYSNNDTSQPPLRPKTALTNDDARQEEHKEQL